MKNNKVDALICLAPRDINDLFIYSIQSCIKNFKLLGHIYVITPMKDIVFKHLRLHNIPNKSFTILSDNDVLDNSLLDEDGWYKQQIIKLNAYKFCSTRFVACLSSDTILLQPVEDEDIFNKFSLPYIYFNKDKKITNHYLYENERITNLAKIL